MPVFIHLPEVPESRREEVVDVLHGVAIADPYRWLEDGASAETRAWTAAQNARTEVFLNAVPGRDALLERLTRLSKVPTVESVAVRGQRIFALTRDPEQAQPALRVREGVDGVERALVDPNALDRSGLTALDWWKPSPDGALVAFGTSESGDEWSTLRVVEAASGRVLPDAIARARYSSVAWLPDGSGFYYTRYPIPGTVPPEEEHYNSHAFFHRLGTDPAADPKVFGEGRSPQDMIELAISPDGRWLVATAFQGWVRSEVYLRDLTTEDGPWVPVVEGVEARFSDAHPTEDRLYLLTNLDASNGRIVAIDPTYPDLDAWTTVVPAREDRTIEGFVLAGDGIVAQELEAATGRLRTYGLDGPVGRELDLPGLGTVVAVDGELGNPLAVAVHTTFTTPARADAFDVGTGVRTPLTGPGTAGEPNVEVRVERVRYASRDGTPIGMFLAMPAALPRDGGIPTILTGYGGFNIGITPTYNPLFLAWLELGGMVAVANLRGGGEEGEAWHRAGMLGNKQSVFDDVVAAAEWLIAEGYTAPERLAIYGGSNGGLLVGAAITQRPDLFAAALCAVPLLDMLRYHRFSIAKLWVPEYGSADDPDAFRWLHAYSPYHRVVPGTRYPAVLLTTAEEDSRVDPLHARKMAALLQWAATGVPDARPVLLRAEEAAGHGVGKPLGKQVAEDADIGCFLASQLGLPLA